MSDAHRPVLPSVIWSVYTQVAALQNTAAEGWWFSALWGHQGNTVVGYLGLDFVKQFFVHLPLLCQM